MGLILHLRMATVIQKYTTRSPLSWPESPAFVVLTSPRRNRQACLQRYRDLELRVSWDWSKVESSRFNPRR